MKNIKLLKQLGIAVLLTMSAINTALAANASETSIACMLINEGYIIGQPSVFPIPTITLTVNDNGKAHSLLETNELTIELKTAAVMESSLKKPIVSQFLVSISDDNNITTIKSSPRSNAIQDLSVQVNVMNSQGELTLECLTQ